MLNAEHVALHSRLVQQLAAVKQKEIQYLLQRYEAIGVQAALLTGCALQTLVSLDATKERVNIFIRWSFYKLSFWCAMANLWVILCTLYIGNWAPGLTLRGPTGSLNRAFDALVHERKQVNRAFVFGIFTFVLQTTCALWVLKETNELAPEDVADMDGYGIFTSANRAFFLEALREVTPACGRWRRRASATTRAARPRCLRGTTTYACLHRASGAARSPSWRPSC